MGGARVKMTDDARLMDCRAGSRTIFLFWVVWVPYICKAWQIYGSFREESKESVFFFSVGKKGGLDSFLGLNKVKVIIFTVFTTFNYPPGSRDLLEIWYLRRNSETL